MYGSESVVSFAPTLGVNSCFVVCGLECVGSFAPTLGVNSSFVVWE